MRSDGFLGRAAVAGCAVWFYFGKLLWPTDLSFVYPRWNISERDLLSYVPGSLLVAILALAWWRRCSWGRPVVMLMVCYVALLLPVLGFVDIIFMQYSLVADHWQYPATIVPCAVLAGLLVTLGRRCAISLSRFERRPAGEGRRPRASIAILRRPAAGYQPVEKGDWLGAKFRNRWGKWLEATCLSPFSTGCYVFCLGLLAILGVLTFRQSGTYADAETLYLATIDRNPDCWLAHNNLGNILTDQGRTDEAIAHYEKALASKHEYVLAHYVLSNFNLGNALKSRGRNEEAILCYEAALRIDRDYIPAHCNLGSAPCKSRTVRGG